MNRNQSKMITVFAVLLIFAAYSFAALPELKVSTKDNAAINSPAANMYSQSQQNAVNCQNHLIFVHKYVPMTLTLTDPANPDNDIIATAGYKDSIRGRGNSTWAGDKKPYRIKFNEAKSVFGSRHKHKSWALLANWYDQTFCLNAVGFEMGRRIGIPGTPNSFLVDFHLNNQYKGIYQITDIVHVNKGRLNIDTAKGWLAEFDYHCPSTADEVDFATDYPTSPSGSKLHTFIKSPEDLPKGPNGQDPYKFVKNDVNNLMSTMFNKSGFPNNGYRDLVDLNSVAKYLLLEQFLDNFDFNNKSNNSGFPASNFFHKDVGKKITAGPIWDLDLTGGVEYNSFPQHYTTYRTPLMPRHAFYKKFFDDPVFKAKIKKNWIRYKPDFQAMPRMIDSIAAVVQGSVVKNFELQLGSNKTCNDNNTNTCKRGAGGFSGMAPIVLGNLQAYNNEISKLKTWWGNRITFFDQELASFDTSQDIPDDPSPTPTAPSVAQQKHQTGVTVITNGLTVNAKNEAEVVIVSLNGNVIRKQTLASGNHSVKLGDLPKGMYLARVNLDGVRKMVRIAIK
ncbi:MAG: CotH kinase family protein [Chitinispirillales bacterium]|jgi:hypothetical protein|nr:CotH kinase family protein [Chitinispirillales bacterium]